MNKQNNIIYWVTTIWLALGMVSTGMVQLLKVDSEVTKTHTHLGFPIYFLSMIGAFKMAGAIAVLIPKYPKIKEWAYAGFIFIMVGAMYAHFACEDKIIEFFGPLLLTILTLTSWYFNAKKINK